MKVYSSGPLTAKLAFIGEAPGEQEVRRGQPFVGPAGHLLDQLLGQLGLVRSQIYVTNVVKERPPGNDISKFISFPRKGVVKATDAYRAYEQELYRELSMISANCIVLFGNVPLFALARKMGITNWRGSILVSNHESGNRKVIPSIHPAAALREYLYTHLIRHDLKRAKEQSEFPENLVPERIHHLKPNFMEVMAYLADMPRVIGIDIENPNDVLVCLSIAKSPYEAMCIPFAGQHGSYFTEQEEAEIWRVLAIILENPEVLKVIHNAMHEVYNMFRYFGIVIHPIADTCIGCKMVLPDYPKRLAFMASIFTTLPYYKYMGGRQGGQVEVYDK